VLYSLIGLEIGSAQKVLEHILHLGELLLEQISSSIGFLRGLLGQEVAVGLRCLANVGTVGAVAKAVHCRGNKQTWWHAEMGRRAKCVSSTGRGAHGEWKLDNVLIGEFHRLGLRIVREESKCHVNWKRRSMCDVSTICSTINS
jgi:hypothetical protein